MKFTDDYLKQAKKVIFGVYKDVQPDLLKYFGKVEHTLKKDKSVVTELDLEVETKLRQALLKFDPAVGILGEELGQEGSEQTRWLIDPIDGTEGFIRGIPVSRNMVTLVDNGEPVFTLIYKFVLMSYTRPAKAAAPTLMGSDCKLVSDRWSAPGWRYP